MGCEQSKSAVPTETERLMRERSGLGKSERQPTRRRAGKAGQQATKAASWKKRADAPPPPQLDADGRLTAEEVARRTSGTAETKSVTLGTVREGEDERGIVVVRYAALTQRGYYPDDPAKANQDAFRLLPSNFASGSGDAYFAVFDGHGDKGHDCASFAKSKLPTLTSQSIKKKRAAANAARLRESEGPRARDAFHPSKWPYLDGGEYEDACRSAHLGCNRAMHDDAEVKDTLSGTTAISVGFHAGRMTVCNIGDSRAVLGYRIDKDQELTMSGSEAGATPAEEEKKEIGEESAHSEDVAVVLKAGSIVAVPLSEDQTPYRRDERERLRKAGARICSIDQMEGIAPMHDDWGEVDLGFDIDVEGDPPRVWCQDHNYPGTAFSRSLGDSIGEDLGVNAEPEMFTKDVTRGDEILVIASDGIFEFLTNQRVIDICAESGDPQRACARLLEESYASWLEHEVRTDDITVVVLFMENGRENNDDLMRGLMRKRHRIKRMKAGTEAETGAGAAAPATDQGGQGSTEVELRDAAGQPQDADSFGPAAGGPREDAGPEHYADAPQAVAGQGDDVGRGAEAPAEVPGADAEDGEGSYAEFEKLLSSSNVGSAAGSSVAVKAAAE